MFKKLPRCFIYSKEKDLYIIGNLISGGISMIEHCMSFHFLNPFKGLYLRYYKRMWEDTATDWKFKRMHIVKATVGVKAGNINIK